MSIQKSNYDRLCIDKVLGFRKSDNKKQEQEQEVIEQRLERLGTPSGSKNRTERSTTMFF